ncbi:GntR family transcriptional regulator [Micromonospora sp. NPDC050686]|uniref:GntR family transcriptional regulator n=1 Tax=Micromonospora sp. NPDC050686 TaxID=3154631 RepID=UPI0033D8DB31
MIDFQLDAQSGVATYLQLAQQVRHALRLGLLRPGDKLPTAKEVVAKLAINPNTVLKAYRELEREGLVGARPGLGTFVLKSLSRHDPAEQTELRQQLAHWVLTARRAGLVDEDIEAMYRAVMRQDVNDTEALHGART